MGESPKGMSRKPAKEPFVVQFSGSVEALHGGVAQLGEHLPCKQGVKGSIPFISTMGNERNRINDRRG